MNQEATIFVELKPGVCARLKVAVIEEGLPAPHERPVIREPGLTEFDVVAGKLSAKDYKSAPPFEI